MTGTTYQNDVRNPVLAQTNSVTILAAVARDPEIREATATKGAMIRISMAAEELVIGDDGKQRRLPIYEQAIFSGKQADKYIALGLKAGDAVLADGRFTQREVSDGKGGTFKRLDVSYGALRRAVGFNAMERSKDAGGGIRLVGGFARATVFGRVIGNGGELMGTTRKVFKFSVNARAAWKDQDGSWVSDAAFVRSNVWGPLGEELNAIGVVKGMEAFVEGRPSRGSYKNKEGDTVYTLEIEAIRVILAEGMEGEGNAASRSGGGLDSLPPLPSLGGLDLGGDQDDDLPF